LARLNLSLFFPRVEMAEKPWILVWRLAKAERRVMADSILGV
jgi:hypothetical protein